MYCQRLGDMTDPDYFTWWYLQIREQATPYEGVPSICAVRPKKAIFQYFQIYMPTKAYMTRSGQVYIRNVSNFIDSLKKVIKEIVGRVIDHYTEIYPEFKNIDTPSKNRARLALCDQRFGSGYFSYLPAEILIMILLRSHEPPTHEEILKHMDKKLPYKIDIFPYPQHTTVSNPPQDVDVEVCVIVEFNVTMLKDWSLLTHGICSKRKRKVSALEISSSKKLK
jgi:hypothetical protein